MEAVVIGGNTDSEWGWTEPNWGNGTEKVQGTGQGSVMASPGFFSLELAQN